MASPVVCGSWCRSVLVAVCLLSLMVASCVDAMHLRKLDLLRNKDKQQYVRNSALAKDDLESISESAVSEEEPGLFELLISALKEEEEALGSKRDQYKQSSKPCYWSLVSCY